MNVLQRLGAAVFVSWTVGIGNPCEGVTQTTVTRPPHRGDWSTLAKLPDWSGAWSPAPDDRAFPLGRNEPKWLPQIAAQVQQLKADGAAGTPRNVYTNCLPEGMPSFPIMSVSAMEFLFTPGRVGPPSPECLLSFI